jgi:MFS family permease
VNNRLLLLVFVGSLGGFVLGFDLGALSAATQSLKSQLGLSPWAFGLTISASIWGTVAGAILAGRLATRIWQLNLISGCALLYALAAAGIAAPVPAKWPLVLAMRFLCGIAIGGFTVGCPLYLSEVAPIHLRGRVVGAFQLQVSAGVIVYTLPMPKRRGGGSSGWRHCLLLLCCSSYDHSTGQQDSNSAVILFDLSFALSVRPHRVQLKSSLSGEISG